MMRRRIELKEVQNMSEVRSNADRFISAYNQLDEYMRQSLGSDRRNTTYYHRVHGMAERSATFRKHKELLHSFGELRNAIVHDFGRNGMEIIAEPHLEQVKIYEQILLEVMNPPKAMDKLAVKTKELYTLEPGYEVLKAMKIMARENYSYAPVIYDDQLVGVFSEESIFDYLKDNGSVDLTKGLIMKELEEYTKLEAHRSEVFQFASRHETVADLEERLKKTRDQRRRMEVVFITEKGKPFEKLLGMVTIWDLASEMV